MNYETITYEQDGPLAVLTLNRPDKLNSFTSQMHAELRDACAKIDATGTRAMIVTGAGRGFCAGQDLADVEMSDDLDLGETLESNFNPLITWVKRTPFPVICAVNGVAAGAGANFALACDIVIAAKSASFLQAFAKIGLLPDAGGTWTLTQAVGPARATGLAMLAEPISAKRAKKWGLIWDVVSDEKLLSHAREMAEKLANQPTMAFAAIKTAIATASENAFADQLGLEAKLQSELGRSADFVEGVNAFLEKRAPQFKGA
ncbi:MAG: 2-(1,2-epoxy-1,2-dihydrophenyl)acetyl-CoA isomerase PaaG [Hyphomicrobiales bacterium]